MKLKTLLCIMFLITTLNESCQKKSGSDAAPPQTNANPTVPVGPNDPNGLPLVLPGTCPRALESTSTSKTCEVMHQGSGSTYIEGTLITAEGVIPRGGVLFGADGIIQCTGCDCLDAAKAEDATRVSCPQGIISAGLINSHDHLSWANVRPQSSGDERFEHRNDWRGGKRGHKKLSIPSGGSAPEITYGEIRQLMVGTVSIAGSNSADGFLRNIDDDQRMEGLRSVEIQYDTFPLESGGDYSFRVGDCAYSRQSALDYLHMGRHLLHVSEGIDAEARNEFLCLSGGREGGYDATKPRSTYVHAIGLLANDAKKLADEGTAVVWSPRSNIALYGNTASVTLLRNQGVNVALGTDWVPSGSAHLLREMQCAADLNDKQFNGAMSDRDLYLMMTTKGASALKVEQMVGRLAKGWLADIAVYRDLKQANVYRSIMKSEAKDTVLVLRGGKPLYGDQELLNGIGSSCQTLDVCGVSKSICFADEGKGLAASGINDIQGLITKMEASSASYPLFFCEAPKDEPSCSPVRQGEYNGAASDDFDGDGVKDSVDNCPKIFNPIRPLDNGKQADYDGDGIGDVCDLCPMSSDNSSCSIQADDDRDHDGIIDIIDNCPLNANPNQEDSDGDGIGDVCDACAEIANPGFNACVLPSLSTFSASRDQPELMSSIRPSAPVEVKGIVNAIAKSGYYLQDESTAAGVYVYLPKGDKPKLGQKLHLKGVYELYQGEAQITGPVLVETADAAAPEAVSLSNKDIENSSLVGVLVAYEGRVSSGPPVANGSYQETFRLDESVKVGSFLSNYDQPLLGDTFKISGILRRAANSFYIEPRSATDLTLVKSGEPRVATLRASLNFAEMSSSTLGQLTLNLDRPATNDTKVALTSNSASITVPSSVTVLAGTKSIVVPMQMAANASEALVEITASLGDSGSVESIQLLKTFAPHWSASSNQKQNVWVGLSSTLVLATDMPQSFSNPSKIALSYDRSAIEVLAEPVLKAGESKTEVTIKGLKEGQSHLVLEINGSKIDYLLTIRKQDITISEIFYDPIGEDTGLEWIELKNTSGSEIDLSQFVIGAGGVTYATLQYPLKGILPVDGCIVVGGPLSSDKNFFPTYFQAEAFKGGLQNGGAAVDAIGIFKAGVLDAKSIPIDVFAYGDVNKDGFLGKDGTVLSPDLALVKSGASAERHGQTWVEQAKPTPGDCSALTK